MQLINQPRTGISLALFGGLVISIDIPVMKLAGGDPWIFMAFRGFGMAIVLGAIMYFTPELTRSPKKPFADRDFVEVGILYGISSILFTLAVFSTSTANLVFILAFNPLLAALFAWWMIGEKPRAITWIAIAFTVIGVAIIVQEGIDDGNLFGDLLALGTSAVLGLSVVRARKSGKDMSLSGTLGGLIAGFFALPVALAYSNIPDAPHWLVLNGFIMAPAAAFALSLAPRFIPAPQVAMFFLLETVLAPIWVWLIFFETPTNATLLGGAIVLAAIAGHSLVQLRFRV